MYKRQLFIPKNLPFNLRNGKSYSDNVVKLATALETTLSNRSLYSIFPVSYTHLTGSGAMSAATFLGLPFIQEVVACKRAVEKFIPQTDVVIELGGEDAKIIYFDQSIEQRMNGTCAGDVYKRQPMLSVTHTGSPLNNSLYSGALKNLTILNFIIN